ncbi:hypothetical protein KRX54_06710 [Actinomycetaceae bacterium TAE3-ERU4]|nr:hypothetical protein [Actinomycetaceae bacterium TAE3-ERU4]
MSDHMLSSPHPLSSTRRGIKGKIIFSIGIFFLLLFFIFGLFIITQPSTRTLDYSPDSYSPNGTSALSNIASEHRKITTSIYTDVQAATAYAKARKIPLIVAGVDNLNKDEIEELKAAQTTVIYLNTTPYLSKKIENTEIIANPLHNSLPSLCKSINIGASASPPLALNKVPPSPFNCYRNKFGALWHEYINGSGNKRIIISDASLFMNKNLEKEGNAAIALYSLGHNQEVIWLLALKDKTPKNNSLTSPAVQNFLYFTCLVFVVGAIVRGKRFGPLQYEKLPVTVPATETREGRKALYQKYPDYQHALRLHREKIAGIILKRTLGPHEDLNKLIPTLSAATGKSPLEIKELFTDPCPNEADKFAKIIKQLTELS